MTLSVDPKYHPKIIGRKGAVISQIRKDHDVSVQFPDKSDEQQVCTMSIPHHQGVAAPRGKLTFLLFSGRDSDLGL